MLSDSGNAFPVNLSAYHSECFGSTDDLAGLILIFWEFLPEQVCDIWHRPVGGDHQNLHDKVDYSWDFDFSRIG